MARFDLTLGPTAWYGQRAWVVDVATRPRPAAPFLQSELDESQWWPQEEMRRQQFRQLGILVEHAWRTIAAQRERLEAAGLEPGKPLDDEAWRRVPVLTREAVQRAGETLASPHVPESHGEIIEMHSSGSTSTPIRVLGTALDAYFYKAFVLRGHLWHGTDFSGTIAAITNTKDEEANGPDGKRYRRWGDRATYPFETGPAAVLGMRPSIERQAAWLARQNPDYIMGFPSNLLAIAEHCRERGIALPNLRAVHTKGEVVEAELRQVCREVWGAPVIDVYSANEVGVIAHQCPEHEHYHVQSENILVEVLDDQGRPCAPGEVGRVVVTPLRIFAKPLIRYALGDYAEVGAPCPCGRGLAVLNRIMGRVRNILITPGGDRYWPSFGAKALTRIAPITRFQFVQRNLETIEARLVADRPLTPEEEDKVRRHIQSRLPCRFDIALTYHDDLPRGPGGKFEYFRSEVAA